MFAGSMDRILDLAKTDRTIDLWDKFSYYGLLRSNSLVDNGKSGFVLLLIAIDNDFPCHDVENGKFFS